MKDIKLKDNTIAQKAVEILLNEKRWFSFDGQHVITVKEETFNEFLNVSRLLVEIMVESEEQLDNKFKVSDKAKNDTALNLMSSYFSGEFTKTDNGYYYPQMIDDFGGLIQKEIDNYLKALPVVFE